MKNENVKKEEEEEPYQLDDDDQQRNDSSSFVETKNTSTSTTTTTAVLPVDRFWITKILQKHNYYNTTTTTTTNDASNNSRKNNIFWNKAFVLAPMVDQSDFAFRYLCRKYGTNITYTPMIHAGVYSRSAGYRQKFSFTGASYDKQMDRPCIAQLCGSDPSTLLNCALDLQKSGYIDGIDLNCGCPQGIARRGNYGAFLLEQKDTLLKAVKTLTTNLSIPVSVKVRLLPCQTETIELMKALVEQGGIHLLTIHGRTRHQKGNATGPSDWYRIREIVDLLGQQIPIFANGSISTVYDVYECLKITNADGIMSSEAILEYPALFYPIHLYNHHSITNNLPEQEQKDMDEDKQQNDDDDHDEKEQYQHYKNIVSCSEYTQKIGQLELALEYLNLVHDFTDNDSTDPQKQQKSKVVYPPDQHGQGSGLKCIRIHIHRFLHGELSIHHPELRNKVATAKSIQDLYNLVKGMYQNQLERANQFSNNLQTYIQSQETYLSWYMRHRIDEMEEAKQVDDDNNNNNNWIQSYNVTIVLDPTTGKQQELILHNRHVICDDEDAKLMNLAKQQELKKKQLDFSTISTQETKDEDEDAAVCADNLFGCNNTNNGDDDDDDY